MRHHEGRKEQAIAGLLHYGVWLASGLILAGLLASWLPIPSQVTLMSLSAGGLVKGGVALFILLPVSRVAFMLFLFARERDAACVVISALVLAIVGIGFLAGR